jgi:hypothetical protein
MTPQRSGIRPGRLVAIIVGSLCVLIAIGLLVGGGTLLWAHQTQRDTAGFYSTRAHGLATTTYALTSRSVDLGTEADNVGWVPGKTLGTVRLRVTANDGRPVFIGIGRAADVERYLAGVAHDEIASIRVTGGAVADVRVGYRRQPGTATPTPPTETSSTWSALVAGPGTQTLPWTLRGGDWQAVIMNADGSPGVLVAASVGGKAGWVLGLAVGLLVGGGALLLAGSAAIVFGAHRLGLRPATAQPATAATGAAAYPLRLEGDLDEPLGRGLWLVKWLLAIPHLIVLSLLWLAFGVLTFVAFLAILVTGRYPRGLFDFNVGVLRWTWRVGYYCCSALGTDRYPPFSLEDDATYPARLAVAYPERLSRGLVLVKWLLVIPHALVVAVLAGGGWWGSGNAVPTAGGLIGVLVLIAAVALLFTGRYPRDLHPLIVGLNRWVYRVIAYSALMRDEYPPFRLDSGARDPLSVAPDDPTP